MHSGSRLLVATNRYFERGDMDNVRSLTEFQPLLHARRSCRDEDTVRLFRCWNQVGLV